MAEIFNLPSQRLDFLYDETKHQTYIKSSIQVYLYVGESINPLAANIITDGAPFYEYALRVEGQKGSPSGSWWLGEVWIPVSDRVAYTDDSLPVNAKVDAVHNNVTIMRAAELESEYFFVTAYVERDAGTNDVSNHIKKDGNVEID
jgi:hypothetical protein